MMICRLINSLSNKSPATFYHKPPQTSASPPDFIATPCSTKKVASILWSIATLPWWIASAPQEPHGSGSHSNAANATHKYDPIPHREYFSMMAFLDNADEPVLELPNPDQKREAAARLVKADELVASLPLKWSVKDPLVAWSSPNRKFF